MALDNNAALAERHFGGVFGELSEGARADLIVMDYRPMTPLTAENVNGHLLFGTNGKNVITTVANGRILMENREITCVDEEKLQYECRRQAGLLWQALGAQ